MTAGRPVLPLLLFAVLLAGCARVAPPRPSVEVPPTAAPVKDYIVYSNTVWSGDLRVERPVIVARTATLTVAPGTRVYFDIPEPAPGKDRHPWVLVQGGLVAMGSAERPISFLPAKPSRNEWDDVIYLEGAKEAHLRFCTFAQGPWALHVHDTPVTVTESEFRDSYGGVRFQGGQVTLRGNRFLNNQIGVRCLKASPTIEENTFTGNLTGVFFREGVSGAVLRRNNFDNREYDVKLGEGQTEDVDAAENWWNVPKGGRLGERIFDVEDGENLGRVVAERALPAPWGVEPKKP